MKFRDLVGQIIADRTAELIAEATVAGEAEALRIGFTASQEAAERRAQHEADLAEHWQVDDVVDARRVIREFHGRHAARWVSSQRPIAVSTARRWLGPNPPASRVVEVVDLARLLVQEHIIDDFEQAEAQAAAAVADAVEAARVNAIEEAAAAAAAAGPALAAPKVRGMVGASVGRRVAVAYEDDDDGDRDIYDVDVDFDPIADLLEQGELDLADEAFDEAVLDSYGDLGGTLTVNDYPDGITLN